MSFLNCLDRVGGALCNDYATGFQQQLYMAQLQQQYEPIYHCKHGQNCSLCLEEAKKVEAENKRLEELRAQKKLEYQKRCKIYMEIFHHK